jgi:hypothetical protein
MAQQLMYLGMAWVALRDCVGYTVGITSADGLKRSAAVGAATVITTSPSSVCSFTVTTAEAETAPRPTVSGALLTVARKRNTLPGSIHCAGICSTLLVAACSGDAPPPASAVHGLELGLEELGHRPVRPRPSVALTPTSNHWR